MHAIGARFAHYAHGIKLRPTTRTVRVDARILRTLRYQFGEPDVGGMRAQRKGDVDSDCDEVAKRVTRGRYVEITRSLCERGANAIWNIM